jgi:4a-hydroxytetrahydrobiopterin dehydratase
MSEQGWRDFLSAEGVEDWVVLHGGPTAVFTVGSLLEAAQLAEAVAAVPGLEERTLMSVARDRLTIKLTREMWGTEARHVEVAMAISRTARERGATADRSAVQEVQLAVAAKPDDIDLPFWRAVLGYAPLHEDNAMSVAREVAEQRLAAALAAGGRIVDESEAPASWILADRAGNKVCIAAWPDGAKPNERAET